MTHESPAGESATNHDAETSTVSLLTPGAFMFLAAVGAILLLLLVRRLEARNWTWPTREGVAAAHALPAGRILSTAELTLVPTDSAHILTQTADVAGKVTLRPIALGELIRAEDLAPAETLSGTVPLVITLKAGSAALGPARPGSRVTVYFVMPEGEGAGVRMFADLLLLGNGRDEAAKPATAIVAVPAADAKEFSLAQSRAQSVVFGLPASKRP